MDRQFAVIGAAARCVAQHLVRGVQLARAIGSFSRGTGEIGMMLFCEQPVSGTHFCNGATPVEAQRGVVIGKSVSHPYRDNRRTMDSLPSTRPKGERVVAICSRGHHLEVYP
jgi:hypothetical protein